MVALVVESWIWYGFATALVLLRIYARILNFGAIKRLQLDDILMLVVLCFYTTEIVSINIVATADTNLFPPGYLKSHTLTSADMSNRVYGSKMVLVVEQCQCVTTWLVKACLLLLYDRITRSSFPRQNIAIRILAAYVAFTFVFMEIFYFAVWCRPFHDYWAVPTPSIQCSAAIHHLITNAVFNLSSDVSMLLIALPMFLRSHLPLQRKIALSGAFSLGIFVILCAILNKYYSFTEPFGSEWTFWYIRESSTAVLVANLPFTWGLFRRILGLNDDAATASATDPAHSSSKMRKASSAVQKPLRVMTNGRFGNSKSRGDASTRYMASSVLSRSSQVHTNGAKSARFGLENDVEKCQQYTGPNDLSLGNAGGLDLSPCQEEKTEDGTDNLKGGEDASGKLSGRKHSSSRDGSTSSKASIEHAPLTISDKAVLSPSRRRSDDSSPH